jgi:5'(3')-deoxyribonucleotidase
MTKLTIAVDVDDVCLSLVGGEWLRRYNIDYKDTLQKEDITDWDISKFVKPECGGRIYSYLKDGGMFMRADMIGSALWGVSKLKFEGHRVIFVTALDVEGAKLLWLKTHKFLEDKSDLVVCYDKSLVRANILIDDKYENVKSFVGRGILFSQPWNARFTDVERVNGWNNLIKMFSLEGIINEKNISN